MANKRDIKLNEYNISKYAYRELNNFCLQYPEKKELLNFLSNPLKGQQYTATPHSTGVSDPTADLSIKLALLSSDIDLIEQSAKEADADIYEYILLAVTQNIPFYCLKALKQIPCGPDYFYKRRRYFYFILANKKGII